MQKMVRLIFLALFFVASMTGSNAETATISRVLADKKEPQFVDLTPATSKPAADATKKDDKTAVDSAKKDADSKVYC